MQITAFLDIINSTTDTNGNRYLAFRFTDCDTGNVVEATISGGESNINAVRRCWGRVDGWDETIRTRNEEMGPRAFSRLTKRWPYAGCAPEEIADYIKTVLREGTVSA